jgi:cobalt/nickel transport system permease protein
MHIPDGYLSPETCGAFGVAMIPVWTTAGRRVRKLVKNRYVPLVALGAAYSFLVMMFNLPVPDGTTAHAVGAVLIAVVLGPWAAVVAVSIALVIQALFFGDGGVLALAPNAFNMAFVMPMVGYGVYWSLCRNLPLTSPRRSIAAGVGGYIGLNAAALCAGTELGLQPMLFHSSNGTPLYAPFHLSQSLPAMALAHLTVAGIVEFALTAGVVAYLQKANLPLLRINHGSAPDSESERVRPGLARLRWGVVSLGAMLTLTPLGLLAPGRAFGEDTPSDLPLRRYGLDAVPSGLRHYAGFWHHALFNGYGFDHDRHPTLGYLISAFVGIAAIAALALAVSLLVRTLHRPQRIEARLERSAP